MQGCSTSGRLPDSSRRSLLLAGLAGLVCAGVPLQAQAIDQEFVRRGLVDYDELLDSGKLTQKAVESLRRCVWRAGLFPQLPRATRGKSPGTQPSC